MSSSGSVPTVAAIAPAKAATYLSIKEYLDAMNGCCVFCRRELGSVDAQIVGETKTEENISVHFYCMILATDLFQRGLEQQGIQGFLLPDIKKRLMKLMRVRCNYCLKFGASISCAKRNCNRVFHYPCGVDHHAMANYNSEDFEVFCGEHRRIQNVVPQRDADGTRSCVTCLEDIVGEDDSFDILVSPCCRKSYHKECVRRHASTVCRRNFKCCHCRNAVSFRRCVQENGILISDLEDRLDSALVEHYRDASICSVQKCLCPEGRQRVDNHPHWEVVLCDTCGDNGTHLRCSKLEDDEVDYYCEDCARDRMNEYRKWMSEAYGEEASTQTPCEDRSTLVAPKEHNSLDLQDFSRTLPATDSEDKPEPAQH